MQHIKLSDIALNQRSNVNAQCCESVEHGSSWVYWHILFFQMIAVSQGLSGRLQSPGDMQVLSVWAPCWGG